MFTTAINQIKAEITYMRTFFNEQLIEVGVSDETAEKETVVESTEPEQQDTDTVQEPDAHDAEPVGSKFEFEDEEEEEVKSPNHGIWANKRKKRFKDRFNGNKKAKAKEKEQVNEEKTPPPPPYKVLKLRSTDIDLRHKTDDYEMGTSKFEFEDEELNEICRMKEAMEKKR